MKLLEGKIVIVTGASRGIGEAIAIRMAEQGAHIAFSFLSSEEKAKTLEQKLQAFGVKAKGYKSNAGSYEDCEKFVNEVVAEHGTVDVCINNAGISKDSLLMRFSPAQWDEVMEINLKSVFNMTKQVIRPMMKARKRFDCQHEFHYRNPRKRRSVKLCSIQGRYYRIYKIHSTRIGQPEYTM